MEEQTGFIDKLAKLVTDFDMEKFMPKLDSILGWVELLSRLAVMAGPIVLLVLGLIYYFAPPKEANHSFGYRFYWGMGSVQAWRFTQRIAGITWSVLGLVLTVVMLLITNGFRGMEQLKMVDKAVLCLLWELGLSVGFCLLIDLVILLRYDRRGAVRPGTIIRVSENFLALPYQRIAPEEPFEEEPLEELPEEEYPEPMPEPEAAPAEAQAPALEPDPAEEPELLPVPEAAPLTEPERISVNGAIATEEAVTALGSAPVAEPITDPQPAPKEEPDILPIFKNAPTE